MRYASKFLCAIVLSTAGLLFVPGQSAIRSDSSLDKPKPVKKCPSNPDKLYERKEVFRTLVDVLNESAPDFKHYEANGFYVQDERPRYFFVFDITDPSNGCADPSQKPTPHVRCINFVDGHIYHFSATYIPFSLSHIAFLEKGKVRVFRSINCGNPDKNLQGVVSYAKDKLKLNDADEILLRLKDYRKHGHFWTVDETAIRCDQPSK